MNCIFSRDEYDKQNEALQAREVVKVKKSIANPSSHHKPVDPTELEWTVQNSGDVCCKIPCNAGNDLFVFS